MSTKSILETSITWCVHHGKELLCNGRREDMRIESTTQMNFAKELPQNAVSTDLPVMHQTKNLVVYIDH